MTKRRYDELSSAARHWLVAVGIVAKIVLGAVQVAVARRVQTASDPAGGVRSRVE